jgi:hypothetical protein
MDHLTDVVLISIDFENALDVYSLAQKYGLRRDDSSDPVLAGLNMS